MNKQEFIDRLRAALNGKIPASQVDENIDYYNDYINVEIRKGRTEEDVMESLGDPRLIARTIIQTNGTSSTAYGGNGAAYHESAYQGNNYRDTRGEYQTSYGDSQKSFKKKFSIPTWLIAIIAILIIFFIISIIFSVLSFLAPVIIVILAVCFLVKLFRDWLN